VAVNPRNPAVTQGRALKAERVKAGLTQQEAADLVDVAAITLSRWERGTQPIPEEKARALREHYSRLRGEAEREAPKVALGLPPRIRVWIQEFLLELTRADVSEREVDEARRVLTNPDFTRFFTGGEPTEETLAQLLEGLEGYGVAIKNTLRSRGYSIAK
jgi:transcriptional regulator with XRE-family HTH domain